MTTEYINEINELLEKHNGDITKLIPHFLFKCEYGSVDYIKYLISLGMDPRLDNDTPFIKSCSRTTPEMMLFFLNEYYADINAQNGKAMVYAIGNHCLETINILLDNGIILTDKAIREIFRCDGSSVMKLLLQRGEDPERLFRIFLEEYFNKDNDIAANEMLKYFDKYGTDFNAAIKQFNATN